MKCLMCATGLWGATTGWLPNMQEMIEGWSGHDDYLVRHIHTMWNSYAGRHELLELRDLANGEG